MSNKYRRARALGPEVYAEQLQQDQELLDAFGLKLLDVTGGMSVALMSEVRNGRINPWNRVTIDFKLYAWLEPLLDELRTARQTQSRTPPEGQR